MESELFAAASDGNVEQMKKIIDGRSDHEERCKLINAADGKYWTLKTLLHVAAEKGHCNVIDWILSDEGGRAAGFKSVSARTNTNSTALHEAVRRGHLKACQVIIKGCTQDEREEILNAVEGYGWTVLHRAALAGSSTVISWLLSNEEGGGRAAGFKNVLARTNATSTALHEAIERGHIEACQAIINGCTQEEREEMLNAENDARWTVLHIAAAMGHSSIVSWLLSNEEGGGRAAGFNKVLARTNATSTALHVAAAAVECYNRDAYRALLDGCTEEERQQLLTAVDERESTPLHEACRIGNLESCQMMANACSEEHREALLNAKSRDGVTMLHLAAATKYGSLPLVRWLVSDEEGGGFSIGFRYDNLFASNDFGETPLHIAVKMGSIECIETLVCCCRSTADRLRLLHALSQDGWTILHTATWANRVETISHLLHRYPELQMIVNSRDNRGMTALHLAVIEERWSADPISIVAALLGMNIQGGMLEGQQAKADPNVGVKLLD